MKKVQAGGPIRSSLDNTWGTPESILGRARVYFRGDIPFDAATAPTNPTRALRFCAGPGQLFGRDGALEEQNGLAVDWRWPTWVNPPYGSELRDWLLKIEAQSQALVEILALLPCSRWEQRYFTRVLECARAICFHEGRVAFVSSIDGAAVGGNPYASMLLGFNVDRARFAEAFAPLGPCFSLGPLSAAPLSGVA